LTPQRQIILEELRKVTSHPTADQVYEMVRKRLPKISLGTVYRNLEFLSEAGLIQKLDLPLDQMRFDGNPEEHSHIRCLKCGRVADLPVSPALPDMDLEGVTDFTIVGCKIDFYGYCPKCNETTDA